MATCNENGVEAPLYSRDIMMKTTYKPKSWYKQVINIAKGQLQIEEDNYRAILQDKTGKQSLTDMNIPELYKILEHMKKLGFKPKANKSKSPKTSGKAESTHTMLDKLRQIWIQMHYQGFISNGSEQSLQTWASNQSKRLNKGVPITKLEWMKGNMLYALIEQLKKWHMRLLGEALPEVFNQVRKLYFQSILNDKQRKEYMSFNARLSEAKNSHQVVSSAYGEFLNILKQHNISVEK